MKIKINRDIVLNFIVSVGAAIVIFGAWAKILHKSFADTMLTVGLLTECFIFLLYAFVPPKKEINNDSEVLHTQKFITHNHNAPDKIDMKSVEELNNTLKKIFNL